MGMNYIFTSRSLDIVLQAIELVVSSPEFQLPSISASEALTSAKELLQ